MASHLCEQQAAIVAVLHGKRNLHHLECSSWEWHILEDLVKLLEPFKNATEVLSGQKYPTLSGLSPILADFTEKIEYNPLESMAIKSAKEALRTGSWYKDIDVLLLIHKATFLDLRFKTLLHLSATEIESKTLSLQREMVVLLQNQSQEISKSVTSDTSQKDENAFWG